jgi:thymidylate kinase
MKHPAARLLTFLNANDVGYCVVGSARNDPDSAERDLDLIVRPGEMLEAGRLARKFCQEHSGRLIDAIRTKTGGWCYLLAWPEDLGPVTVFRLDIHAGITFGHRPIIGAHEVLATRRKRSSSITYYTSAPGIEVVRALLKAVDGQELTARAEGHLSEVWNEDPKDCRAEMARHWSADVAALLARAVETRDFAQVRKRLPHLRPPVRPLKVGRYLQGAVAEVARQVNPQAYSQGFTVAFLGIDGSGKGSVIQGLTERLAPVFSGTRYFHFKPNLIGPAPKTPPGPMVYPARPAPGMSSMSATRLLYYLLDYWVGFAWKVWPQRFRSSLVIFDRYFYDLGIDPLRLEGRLPMALARSLGGFVPKPDLVIVLDAPAEVARARKPEGPTIEETGRQRIAFLKLAGAMPNARILDGTKAVAEVVQEAEKLILDRLSAGAGRRLE